jgi:EmrB/QacA subfamily drug resistance transporter
MENSSIDYSRKWLVMSAVASGVFLATIDGSIVNIALNTLVIELKQPLAIVEWVVLGYLLTVATLILSVGRLADMIGKKKIYAAGLAVFTLGSGLCGLAPTVYWLIGFRVLQAAGAAMIMALGTAIVTEAFPDRERGKAMGIIGLLVSIGVIAGPTLGGIILQSLTWHWLFFVNLPVGLIGLVLVFRFVPSRRPVGKQSFDYWGAVTLFISLASFLLSLSVIQLDGFTNPFLYGLLALWLVTLLVFIRIELRIPEPMIDLRMFLSRLFSINLITGLLSFIASAGTILLMPFYLQNVLGYDPQKTGLLLVVTPLAIAVVAPISGALSDRMGSRLITTVGLVIAALGYGLVSTIDASTSMFGYVLRFLPVGIGMGIFQSPNNSAVMGSAPKHRLGVASGLLSLTRVLGQTAGIAILGALWEARVIKYAGGIISDDVTTMPIFAQVKGLHDALIFTVVIMLVAVGFSLWALLQAARSKNAEKESIIGVEAE